MLILLTADRQAGKTRWLESFAQRAQDAKVQCTGVICPGTWEHADDGTLVKTGIEALLLPQRKRLPFALRRDLSSGDGSNTVQADAARLGWRIYDEAIDAVNAHFRALARTPSQAGGVLIVDELGTLELVREEGFVEAVRLLETLPAQAGTTPRTAITIVRPELVATARERFEPLWDEVTCMDIQTIDDWSHAFLDPPKTCV